MESTDLLFLGLLLSGGAWLLAAWSWFMGASQKSSMGPPLSVPNVKRAASLTGVALGALGMTLLFAALATG